MRVELVKDNSQDPSGFCNSRALGVIKRYTIDETEFEEMHKKFQANNAAGSGSGNVLTLLNCLYSPSGALKALVSVLSRLEDLSHILVWSTAALKAPNEPCSIDVVELPRLGLTFRSKKVSFTCFSFSFFRMCTLCLVFFSNQTI